MCKTLSLILVSSKNINYKFKLQVGGKRAEYPFDMSVTFYINPFCEKSPVDYYDL